MTANIFAVPVFFICFRECLETSIIVSVLLAFLKQTIGPERDRVVYKKLVLQIWLGISLGVVVCLVIGGGIIGAFYSYGKNRFAGAEDLWEGAFSLLATVIISLVGAALLRVSKLQDKWRVKMAQIIEKKDRQANLPASGRFKRWCQRYAMFILPFITVLREGLEAVIFIGGVGLSLPATAFPLAVICGIVAGCLVGYLIYRGGNTAKLQIFLIASTCFLYLVAAGLFSKGVWFLENNAWSKTIGGDSGETGSGPGSYNIRQSVWHVNCCNPRVNGGGGWGILNSILGWQNSATYGTVLSYNLYWMSAMVAFASMRYYEKTGHWPLMPKKPSGEAAMGELESGSSSQSNVNVDDSIFEKAEGTDKTAITVVRDSHPRTIE